MIYKDISVVFYYSDICKDMIFFENKKTKWHLITIFIAVLTLFNNEHLSYSQKNRRFRNPFFLTFKKCQKFTASADYKHTAAD